MVAIARGDPPEVRDNLILLFVDMNDRCGRETVEVGAARSRIGADVLGVDQIAHVEVG